MASPTEAEMNTQLQNAVALLDHLLAAQTVPADQDTYVQSLNSDFASQQAAGAAFFRSQVSSALGAGDSVLGPVFLAYAKHIADESVNSVQDAITAVYKFFNDNSKSVKERAFVRGAPTGFGGTRPTMVRHTIDENLENLEASFAEVKNFTVVSDLNTGADQYSEVIRVDGGPAGDRLDATGTGNAIATITAQNAIRDSLLANPSFTRFSSTATPVSGRTDFLSGDSISSWTPTTAITNFAQTTADFGRAVVGDGSPACIIFKSNDALTQAFSVNRLSLNASNAYVLDILIKPAAGVTAGLLTVTVGGASFVIDLSTLTAGSWQTVKSVRGFPSEFNTASAVVKLALAGLTGGELLVDEVTFESMTPIDGTWFHQSANHVDGTDLLLDDTQSVTDTIAADSKIQKWLWRVYGRSLPSAAVPTLADPA